MNRLPEHIAKKISPEPNTGCWFWMGASTTGGYGIMTRKAANARTAHRIIYELLVGPVDPKLDLDHTCRVRCCVNPEHLEPVTRRENIRRGDHPAAISIRTGKCKRGHELKYRYGQLYCQPCNNINRQLRNQRKST